MNDVLGLYVIMFCDTTRTFARSSFNSRASILACRRKAACFRTTLTATATFLRSLSKASTTVPNVPDPSFFSTRYRPPRTSPLTTAYLALR